MIYFATDVWKLTTIPARCNPDGAVFAERVIESSHLLNKHALLFSMAPQGRSIYVAVSRTVSLGPLGPRFHPLKRTVSKPDMS